MKIKNKKINKKNGFTLIEMLIAVLIFSLSLSSFMSITAKSLKASRNAEEQLVADYLAIEAIEVVHNLRDAALLKGFEESSWELVFQGGGDIIGDDEGCFDGSGYCNFYFQPGDSQPVLDKCPKCDIYLQNERFFYFQVHEVDGSSTLGGTKTKYKRKIKIESIDEGQIIVRVVVDWDGGEVVYSENLYLWQ